jgi:acyl carrier protein phosphodiesterase
MVAPLTWSPYLARMNYLAHIYLSGESNELLAGNFMGDAIKGRDYTHLPEEVQKGVSLHRYIDSFTDSNDLTRAACVLCREKLGKYAPVAVDMIYDHLLAKNWAQYHPDSLRTYTEAAFGRLAKFTPIFPAETKRMFKYMSEQNWLLGYATVEGLNISLSALGSRQKYKNSLHLASSVLQERQEEFEAIFNLFFPQLVLASSKWITSQNENQD